jgi:hypothetical protein
MPSDDLILNVRQVAQYPQETVVQPTDAVLLQSGGIGGPYYYAQAQDLVGTALIASGALGVGIAPPADAVDGQIFADGLASLMGGWHTWNSYASSSFPGTSLRLVAGPSGMLVCDASGLTWNWSPGGGGPGSPIVWTQAFNFSGAGYLTLADQIAVARDPAAPLELATMQYVGTAIGAATGALQNLYDTATVWSVNGRTGYVMLGCDDILAAGGAPIYSPNFMGQPTAPTPDLTSNGNQIATTAFAWASGICLINNMLATQPLVFSVNGMSGDVVLTPDDFVGFAPIDSPAFTGTPTAPTPPNTDDSNRIATTAYVVDAVSNVLGTGWAPLNSPQFSGTPTAPTPPAGISDGSIATTAFVMNAISNATAGVASFNTRTGAVVLEAADITEAGGALLASPAFSGVPTGPTAAPGTSTTQLATTAFVAAAIGTPVTSFNGRGGAVTLTTGDITGAGGAPLASPALTGTPTAPTAAVGTSTSQIATTDFVQAAIAANTAGVASFNGRTGVVQFQANDISAVGGALTSSPAFSGTPTGPTAAVGTNTTQLATTAFVQAAIAGAAAVTSFNTRTGAITLTSADITSAGGALTTGPAFTGTPTAPTAAPGTSTTQLATTAFVSAAIGGGQVVSSFNTRTGNVTLTAADITGAGGAVLNSPSFTGVPLAPTASTGTANNQIATTQFVQAAIAGGAVVTSFNSRTGAITLQGNDISGAGGALLASPVFSGTPSGPTATPGTSTTQFATTAFVMGELGTLGGVTSFNGRAGVVNLTLADVTGVGGAPINSPSFTGTPSASFQYGITVSGNVVANPWDLTSGINLYGGVAGFSITAGQFNVVSFSDIFCYCNNTGSTASLAAMIGNPTTFEFPVQLPANPTAPLQAATKAYVDQAGGWNNKIVNGTMDVWQRGLTIASPGQNTVTADCWRVAYNGTAPASVGQSANGVALSRGFQSSYMMTIVGAAGNTGVWVTQRIESFIAGQVAGRTATLQFKLFNNTTATITPSLQTFYPTAVDNFAGVTADLAATNLQPVAAGTVGQCSINFNVSSNAVLGYMLTIVIANAGLTSGTAGVSFGDVDFRYAPGAVIGLNPTPPPPELRPVSIEALICMRYYVNQPGYGTFWSGWISTSGSGTYFGLAVFPIAMRAAPTVTLTNNNNNGFPAAVGTPSNITGRGFLEGRTPNVSGATGFFGSSYTASAEL